MAQLPSMYILNVLGPSCVGLAGNVCCGHWILRSMLILVSGATSEVAEWCYYRAVVHSVGVQRQTLRIPLSYANHDG